MVGLTPLDTRPLAHSQHRTRLRSSDRTIASMAADFGYRSESAFSHAFTMATDHAPRLGAPVER
jgi:AraC-like DNA-binding protein